MQLLHRNVHLSIYVELLRSICACWIRSSRYTDITVLIGKCAFSLMMTDFFSRLCFSLVDSSRKCAYHQLY